jgi:hypothetical protein
MLDSVGAGAELGAPLVVQKNAVGADIGVLPSAVAAGVPTRPTAVTHAIAAPAKIERERIPGLLREGRRLSHQRPRRPAVTSIRVIPWVRDRFS